MENSAASYETRVFSTGQVDTRRANLHDLFNALVWLAFPRTKAALNARHVARLAQDGARRGSLRDTLTLIDEGGVIVACAENFLAEAESLIRLFRWQELFWERRVEMLRNSRFVLVGHSAYEKALKPYPGITCKALFIATPPALIDGPSVELTQWLDDAAEKWITNLPDTAAPRQMAPLPVFGYPGWLAEAKGPGFYADRRWFRAAPAPSGRGSAEKLERVP